MTTRSIAALLGALTLVVAACGDDDSGDSAADTTAATQGTTPVTTTEAPPETTTTAAPETTAAAADDSMCGAVSFSLDASMLPELAGEVHYEGWAIIDGAPVTTGKFDVADGEAVFLDGSAVECFSADGLEDATTLVITIEPAGDADSIPSDTHFLAGDIADKAATLTIDHPAAIGTDFAGAAGTVLLATPTDGDGTNELSGIWFLELPGPTPSLVLPALPAGWAYEGWAVIDGVPVTSGTFLTADGFDDFDGYSGDQGGPPFPGEDYLVNAPEGVAFPTDLTGATIVVSVEPSPDDSPAPFILKPLLGTAGDPATDHESYVLDNNAGDPPVASVVIG